MKKVFAFTALIAMLFVACDNGGNDVGNNTKLKITSSSNISIGAEEYEGEITYSIVTPVEGATVEATADVSWIKDIVCGESVTFRAEANSTKSSRIGKITLTYDGDSVAVGVMQSGSESGSDATALRITSERSIHFTAVGGEGVISYTIDNNVDDLKADATTSTMWISSISVEPESISFKVSKNTTTTKRTGSVEVVFGDQVESIRVTQDAASNEPELVADSNVVRVGTPLYFTVVFNAEDVTAEAKIYDYDTRAEVPNPITYDAMGEFVYYAEYNGKRSRVLTINVVPEATPDFVNDTDPNNYNFNHRTLIVNHTGVDCPNCPGMKSELKSMSENPAYSGSINIIYSHSYQMNAPCYFEDNTILKSYYKEVCASSYMPFTGYPSATYNFQHNFCAGTTTVRSQTDVVRKDIAEAAVSIASVIDGENLIISAELKSSVSQNYHFALWILEDGIQATQSGGYESWMHEHHDVIRDCLTPISKSDISGLDWGYVVENESSQRVFELPMKSSAKANKDNLKFIVMISAPSKQHDNKYEVVYTQICEIGKNVGFEYK